MWTEINKNKKPKQGVAFCTFRGHVIGIPAEYVDKHYESKVKTTPPVSAMLLILRVPKALQECVGENQDQVNLTRDRPLKESSRAPITIIDGHP